MYKTLGVPSGAIGCVYGSQSGTDCVTSTLITPRNGFAIAAPPALATSLDRATLAARPGERRHPERGKGRPRRSARDPGDGRERPGAVEHGRPRLVQAHDGPERRG